MIPVIFLSNAKIAAFTGILPVSMPIRAIHGGAPMSPHIARLVLQMLTGTVPPKGTYGLTEREKQVLKLLVDGLTRKEISERLFLSPFTVLTHCRNIYSKLHVHTRSSVVAKARKERLL